MEASAIFEYITTPLRWGFLSTDVVLIRGFATMAALGGVLSHGDGGKEEGKNEKRILI